MLIEISIPIKKKKKNNHVLFQYTIQYPTVETIPNSAINIHSPRKILIQLGLKIIKFE